MEEKEVYYYIKGVNTFNIIFPDRGEKEYKTPCLHWICGLKIEGKIWQKILCIFLITLPILPIALVLDICKIIIVDVIIYLIKIWFVDGIKNLFTTVFDSLIKKFLGVIGFSFALFCIFCIYKSGTWENIFDYFVELFS